MIIVGSRYARVNQFCKWMRIQDRKKLYTFDDASEKAYAAAIYLRGIGPFSGDSYLLVIKLRLHL